MVKKTK